MRTSRVLPGLLITAAAALLAGGAATGAVVSLNPVKDNTLYESATGSLSNGAGQNLFAGRTNFFSGGLIRRALLAFDVAGNVPAGSTILNVTLQLNLSQTAFETGAQPFSLHRVSADWGEGTSDPPFQEGQGAAATLNDATWLHRFFNTQFWATPGGDFSGVASATLIADAVGLYTWGSTAAMVANVQGWLDAPATNFGWILIGNELTFPSGKVFDSREHPTAAVRPLLTIEFSTGPSGAGRIPGDDLSGGLPLMVEPLAGGDLRLSWDASCLGTDTDYAVYEGALGSFASHVPLTCSTGGAKELIFTPGSGDAYYLVVPHNGAQEGSYGEDGAGAERPQGIGTCLPQSIACP